MRKHYFLACVAATSVIVVSASTNVVAASPREERALTAIHGSTEPIDEQVYDAHSQIPPSRPVKPPQAVQVTQAPPSVARRFELVPHTPVAVAGRPSPTLIQPEGIAGWGGSLYTSDSYDPSLAVGPNHVVQTVHIGPNGAIAVFTKAGVRLVDIELGYADFDGPGFFEGLGATDRLGQPKCLYDQYADRFIVYAHEYYLDAENMPAAWMYLAISDDSDPMGTWFQYCLDAKTLVGGDSHFPQFPSVGIDSQAIYVAAELYSFGTISWAGSKIRTFDKTPLFGGSTAVYSDLLVASAWGVQAAHCFGTPEAPYFVLGMGNTAVKLGAIRDPLTNPVLITRWVTVPMFDVPPPGGSIPNLVGAPLDALDGRFINATWRNGSLYGAHGIQVGGKTVARWYQIDTGCWPNCGNAPTLVQSGDIDGGPGVYTWLPAIMPNDLNGVAVLLSRSSATTNAGAYYAVRSESDPLGVMAPLVALKAGTGYTGGWWASSCGVALDPTNGLTFWGTSCFGGGIYVGGEPDGYLYTWINTLQACATASPAAVYVSGSYLVSGNGTGLCPFHTINEGINAVASGGQVTINNGTYSVAPLTITKPMTLQAPGSGAVTIR